MLANEFGPIFPPAPASGVKSPSPLGAIGIA